MSLQQFWDQHIIFPKERYRLAGTLVGHTAAVNCTAFLQKDILASGGDDQTIRIWDLQSQKLSQKFDDPRNRWGQITCMVVSDAGIMGGTILCCGTGRGQLVIFKRSKKKNEFQKVSSPQLFEGDSVEDIAYDPVYHRLACTSHNGKIRLSQLQRDGNVVELWEFDSGGDGGIPRTVCFGDKGREVKVYHLETGMQITRDCETAAKKNILKLQSPIGNLDTCPQENYVVIDNMTSGYELYSINRKTPTRSFEIPNGRHYVRMVKFAEKGAVIVGGSDHGCVYIFKISESEPIQVLYHEKADSMIQTIATFSSLEEDMIASGSCDGRFDIRLWRKPSKRVAARPADAWQTLGEMVIGGVFFLFVGGLYMTWTSWVPVVVNGVQSMPQRVQDGIKGPQAVTPYTQVREFTTGPRSANDIGRGGVEESRSAAGIDLALTKLKGRKKGLQVQDRIDLQTSILPLAVELTGGQDVKDELD